MKTRFTLLTCALLFVLASQQPALGQTPPGGDDPCTGHDIYLDVGGSIDGQGGEAHQTMGVNLSDIIDAAGDFLGDVGDALCKLFPCGGTGGDDGGGDDGGGDGGDGGGGNDGGGNDGDGDGGGDTGGNPGGDTGDDAAESSGVCTTGGYSFDKLLNSFTVMNSRYQDGAFHIRLASGTKGHLLHVTVNRAFPLPRQVKRAARLRGKWYVKPGKYEVQMDRLLIPVEKR